VIKIYNPLEVIMKGEIIAQEFNKMVWVSDREGTQYACYTDNPNNVKKKEDLNDEEQQRCLNLNSVLGDSW
jgi:hypothetical protein